jgi:hypothetical protein
MIPRGISAFERKKERSKIPGNEALVTVAWEIDTK